MNDTTDITLIYRNLDGEEFEQPLSDLPEAGILIDPESGDDLELLGWKFTRGDSYVVVEGGLVQNSPGLPVFDLDVLDSDPADPGARAEATELQARIMEAPQARLELSTVLGRLTAFLDRGRRS